MQLNSVVLPAPFGPMSPTISHSLTRRDTSERAWTPPKRIEMPVASSTTRFPLLAPGRSSRPSVPPELERFAAQPLGEGTDLLPHAARVEDQGSQEQRGADERRPHRQLHE